MQGIIISIMNKFGYLGIMLLVTIENLFPPIPSEVILVFGGFTARTPGSKISIIGVIIAATIGSIVGAIILYYIGKILNKERLKKIISGKLGKILRLKPKDIESADKWFDNGGNKSVFFCRFIPVIRSLISIPAGMSEMEMPKFILYTVLGSLIWNTVLVVIGSLVGENWEKVTTIINEYSNYIFILLLIIIIIVVIIFYKRKKNKKIVENE